MPVCKRCEKKWSWKQTIKYSVTLSVKMNCPHCGEVQYNTARSRKRSTIVGGILISTIMLCNIFFGPSYIFLMMLISLIPLWIIVFPFMMELSNEEEPPF